MNIFLLSFFVVLRYIFSQWLGVCVYFELDVNNGEIVLNQCSLSVTKPFLIVLSQDLYSVCET